MPPAYPGYSACLP
ncbi:hypothetical protein COLE_05177 [Cutaneotrichosporon oleaginosum]|nr:hypothetical protein COLE_05177 [Cutaneotrichosporon oleaginosum]